MGKISFIFSGERGRYVLRIIVVYLLNDSLQNSLLCSTCWITTGNTMVSNKLQRQLSQDFLPFPIVINVTQFGR